MKKLNILDWLIVVFILLLLLFGISKAKQLNKNPTDEAISQAVIQNTNAQAILTCQCRYLKENTVVEINNNVKCYDETNNEYYIINNVNKNNYYEYNFDKDNNTKKCIYDNIFNAEFDIKVNGVVTKYGFIDKGGSYIGVGSTKYLIINGIKYECQIIDFNII